MLRPRAVGPAWRAPVFLAVAAAVQQCVAEEAAEPQCVVEVAAAVVAAAAVAEVAMVAVAAAAGAAEAIVATKRTPASLRSEISRPGQLAGSVLLSAQRGSHSALRPNRGGILELRARYARRRTPPWVSYADTFSPCKGGRTTRILDHSQHSRDLAAESNYRCPPGHTPRSMRLFTGTANHRHFLTYAGPFPMPPLPMEDCYAHQGWPPLRMACSSSFQSRPCSCA